MESKAILTYLASGSGVTALLLNRDGTLRSGVDAAGICLPLEQWKILRRHVKRIDIAFGLQSGEDGNDQENQDPEENDEE